MRSKKQRKKKQPRRPKQSLRPEVILKTQIWKRLFRVLSALVLSRAEVILRTPIWKRLFRALPALVLSIILAVALVESDKLQKLEAIGQDIQMRLSQLPSQSDVALVVINDDDFKEIFNSTRPLNPVKLHDLITAVCERQSENNCG